MGIIRIEHDKLKRFVILSKKPLEKNDLSWEAKGLWSYLISRPDNWQISIKHLTNNSPSGREKIRKIIAELIANNLCKRKQVKDPKTGQFTGYEYVIYEEEMIDDEKLNECLPKTGFQTSEEKFELKECLPKTGFRATGFRATGLLPQTNNESNETIKERRNERNVASDDLEKSSDSDVRRRCLENQAALPCPKEAKEFIDSSLPSLNKNELSFEDNLKNELEKSGFNPWDVDVGLKYYNLEKEKLNKKQNKIAYIVTALRKNWAQELVNRKENAEEETIKYKNDINDNVKLSIDTFNELKELDPDEMYYIVRLNEQSLTVNWRDKDKTSTPLDIKDKNFPNEVKQIKFRAANARIGI